MIANFEKITAELSAEEKNLIPILVKGFKAHQGKENAIKAHTIVERINNDGAPFNVGIITQVRLRKLVNFIRRNGILPLIATSEGYYVTQDREEIIKQMKSLQERADAILAAKNGLAKFVEEV